MTRQIHVADASAWSQPLDMQSYPDFGNFNWALFSEKGGGLSHGQVNPTLALIDGQATWKRLYDSPEPQEEPIPEAWTGRLSRFHRLAVLRAVRPDKMTAGLAAFVRSEMGRDYVEFAPPSLERYVRQYLPLMT
jgi:hypothetical protein